jgi:hypothetical protein
MYNVKEIIVYLVSKPKLTLKPLQNFDKLSCQFYICKLTVNLVVVFWWEIYTNTHTHFLCKNLMQQRRNSETVYFRATVFAGICRKPGQKFRLSSYWEKCNRHCQAIHCSYHFHPVWNTRHKIRDLLRCFIYERVQILTARWMKNQVYIHTSSSSYLQLLMPHKRTHEHVHSYAHNDITFSSLLVFYLN